MLNIIPTQSKIDYNSIEGVYTYAIDSQYTVGDPTPRDTTDIVMKLHIDPPFKTQVMFDKSGNGYYQKSSSRINLRLVHQNQKLYFFDTGSGFLCLELRKDSGKKILVRDRAGTTCWGSTLESIENNRFLPGSTTIHFELDMSYYL